MNPVGNDVVDLKAVGNVGKSGDTRFMRRVFTPDEQQAIYRSAHPDKLLWAFWAAKETAYKAAAKTDPDITSAPGRYPVFLDLEYGTGAMRGNVSTPGGPVAVKIRFHEEYVHCVGLGGGSGNLDEIDWGIAGILPAEPESVRVRELAKAKIAELLGHNPADIDIISNRLPGGRCTPPVVCCKGIKQKIDISLSHDGRFVAYALLMAS